MSDKPTKKKLIRRKLRVRKSLTNGHYVDESIDVPFRAVIDSKIAPPAPVKRTPLQRFRAWVKHFLGV